MEFDWMKCVICQKESRESVQCPALRIGLNDPREIYKSFLDNVIQFRAMDALPMLVKFTVEETPDSFASHFASWHKSCYLKFNSTKLKRAVKSLKRRHQTPTKDEVIVIEEPRTKRRHLANQSCILCHNNKSPLHMIQTPQQADNIRTMAYELKENSIISRIFGCNLIEREAKYHLKCLTKLRNRYRSSMRQKNKPKQKTDEQETEQYQAFIEIINYIEECMATGTFFFKLHELYSLYVDRLNDMGTKKVRRQSDLKRKLFEVFPNMREQTCGRNTVLVFESGMKNMLSDALNLRNSSTDAIILSRAAAIIRKDIFNQTDYKFSGKFDKGCQENAVAPSLKTLISYILNGTAINDQMNVDSQPCLTICQAILFNCKKKARGSVKTRHAVERETPLVIYIGLYVHSMSRNKLLIQQLYRMGLSISYKRVIDLEDQIAVAACERFEEDGVVTPTSLRKGLFTVGAIDNLDHNPSSSTSSNSFHGTGISLLQIPQESALGEVRPQLKIPPSGNSKQLPDKYAFVPPVALQSNIVEVPEIECVTLENCLDEAKNGEQNWIEHATTLLSSDQLSKNEALAWSSYHASKQAPVKDPPALQALLPLFYEKSSTPSMIKHGIDVVKNAIEYLNPGQIPVIAFDQPLFAIAKTVQWKWPSVYGEKSLVVMLGGLHTEMSIWKTIGDILDGSGWISALTEAGVASAGTAESYLKVSHLKRTRRAHEVTLLTLNVLMREAFLKMSESGHVQSFDQWKNDMVHRYPTFKYWDLIQRLQTLALIFCRAHREKKFTLYVQCLEEILPFFFAMDHTNYSRWAAVHVRDMKSLPHSIREQFCNGDKWVVSKSKNIFSGIPLDQAHEMENKRVKSSGGVIGITDNPSAMRRWVLSGPEISKLVSNFRDQYNIFIDEEDQFSHHEQNLPTQITFQQQVVQLKDTIEKLGNPFLDEFHELTNISTRSCVDQSSIDDLNQLETVGKNQYETFVKNVFEERSQSIHCPIKKNSFSIFRTKNRPISRECRKIKCLQNNVVLFGQLYVAMQSREGDLREFFAHELQAFPPALSDFGRLHLPSKKSDLLETLPTNHTSHPLEHCDCKILDGMVILHILPIFAVSTFDDYAQQVFLPYLQKQLETSSRLDIVWDRYLHDSLKDSTRERRGKGVRKKVSAATKLPGKWIDFLRDNTNKTELFAFLSSTIELFHWPPGKCITVSSGDNVLSIGSNSCVMPNCNQEEADTRIVFHALHALQNGAHTIQVRTVDTDVIVILIGSFYDVTAKYPAADIWVAFGSGKHHKMISINHICTTMGKEKSAALPFFHSFSGCDTTSAFRGKGKKSVWQTWSLHQEITETFAYLSTNPFQHLDENNQHFLKLERFVILIYDKTSPLNSINECRKELFCKANRSMDLLPPTRNSLLQHARRAIYQAGVWTTCAQANPQIPSPQDYGWTKVSDTWEPQWMTIPEVAKSCRELIKCMCKGNCKICKCAKANLVCSPLCKCKCPHRS